MHPTAEVPIAQIAPAPVTSEGLARPLLGDLASIENATIVGEYDRLNGQDW